MSSQTLATPATRFPFSEAQSELWLLSQVSSTASCAFNEISSLTLRGAINDGALRRAISGVVQRHALLRATCCRDGHFMQIHDELEPLVTEEDWSGLSKQQQDQRRKAAIEEEGHTPFDLENGPLLRIRLQRLATDELLVTFTAHHIIMDGWALWVFCRDLGHLYDSAVTGQPTELPPADDYQKYAATMAEYHASEEGQADERYWLSQFEDSIPVLDLPTDRSRPTLKTFEAARWDHTMDPELVSALRKAGGKHGCSLFNTMLAGFAGLLARVARQQDIVIGIPTAGQAALDQENLLGHCVNSVPFRQNIEPTASLLDLAKRVRGDMMDTLDHQKYTFGTLLKKLAPPRDTSRPPIFSVMFNVDPAINTDELGFDQLDVKLDIEPRAFENFELFINGVVQADGSVEFQCQYNRNLFDAETVAGYFTSYETLLRQFVANPDQPLQEQPLLSQTQQQQQIVGWNQSDLEYPTNASVHAEFQRQAAATPDAVAVQFGDTQLTYRQLDAESNQFARFLTSQGVAAGDLVGICMTRSERLLVALLGVWKAGAGYVPMDPAYPDDRLEYMCQQSQLSTVVTQQDLVAKIQPYGKPTLAADQHAAQIAELDDSPVAPAADEATTAAQTAYVIYTSGSTGKPKGVQVPHGAVVNFLYGMQQRPGCGAADSILAVTTLSFDIAVLELYLPLLSGGRVVIADSESASDGYQLIQLLQQNQINLLQATPATWRLLIASGWEGNADLKALCGGEPMPADLVAPLLDRCGELWNMYGPTETTVWSSCYQIRDAAAPILIGTPIANTQIYLLDEQLQPVPVGVPAEVYIGGAGVTHGYLHREDLTSERFVDNPYFNPFAEYVNHRLYKTGDLARFRHDGNIEFLRRNDKQVKVRGYRIELGEIELTLNAHPAIKQGHVIVREDQPSDTRLVAYFVPVPGEMVTGSDLRKHLNAALPHYMIPQHFVELDAFPQTNNGKVDFKALPAPDGGAGEAAEFIAPETQAEVFLAAIWQELLGTDSISASDNIFNIGGHSLLVMKVIARVEQEWGVRLGPQDFLMGTLEQIAGKLEDASGAASIPDSTDAPQADEKSGIMRKFKGLWN